MEPVQRTVRLQRTIKYKYTLGTVVVAEGEYTQVHAGDIIIEVRFPEGGQPEIYASSGVMVRPFSEHPANSVAVGRDA